MLFEFISLFCAVQLFSLLSEEKKDDVTSLTSSPSQLVLMIWQRERQLYCLYNSPTSLTVRNALGVDVCVGNKCTVYRNHYFLLLECACIYDVNVFIWNRRANFYVQWTILAGWWLFVTYGFITFWFTITRWIIFIWLSSLQIYRGTAFLCSANYPE